MKRKINIALKCIFFTITVGVILYATTIVLERKDSLYKYADFFELAKKDQIDRQDPFVHLFSFSARHVCRKRTANSGLDS